MSDEKKPLLVTSRQAVALENVADSALGTMAPEDADELKSMAQSSRVGRSRRKSVIHYAGWLAALAAILTLAREWLPLIGALQ